MSQAVVCASMNVHFFEDGQPNLQYDIQYAPKFDAPLLDSVGKLLQHVPLDRHIPKFDCEDPEEDDYISEVRALQLEVACFDLAIRIKKATAANESNLK
jgi:hypothetical protein